MVGWIRTQGVFAATLRREAIVSAVPPDPDVGN
jgi:hypothetical protein